MSTTPSLCQPKVELFEKLDTPYSRSLIQSFDLINEASKILEQLHNTNDLSEFLPVIRLVGRALELSECFPTKPFCAMYGKIKNILQMEPKDQQDLYYMHLCKYTYFMVAYTMHRMNQAGDIHKALIHATNEGANLLISNPNTPFLHYQMIVLENALIQRTSRLKSRLRELLIKFPFYYNSHYLLAVIFFNERKLRDSKRHCIKYIEMAPEESTHSAFILHLYCKILLDEIIRRKDINDCIINEHVKLKEAEKIFKKGVNAGRYWNAVTDMHVLQENIATWEKLREAGYKVDEDFAIPKQQTFDIVTLKEDHSPIYKFLTDALFIGLILIIIYLVHY